MCVQRTAVQHPDPEGLEVFGRDHLNSHAWPRRALILGLSDRAELAGDSRAQQGKPCTDARLRDARNGLELLEELLIEHVDFSGGGEAPFGKAKKVNSNLLESDHGRRIDSCCAECPGRNRVTNDALTMATGGPSR
jgi:hypothetical protein